MNLTTTNSNDHITSCFFHDLYNSVDLRHTAFSIEHIINKIAVFISFIDRRFYSFSSRCTRQNKEILSKFICIRTKILHLSFTLNVACWTSNNCCHNISLHINSISHHDTMVKIPFDINISLLL